MIALAALRQCQAETGERLSKRRYEAWRSTHADKASIPSATFIANSFSGGSWAKAMDAAGLEPAPDHRARQLRTMGPAPTDEEVLEGLRRCARELGTTSMTQREYREWALADMQRPGGPRVLLLSPSSFHRRFGGFGQARMKAGLGQPGGLRSPRPTWTQYAQPGTLDFLHQAKRSFKGPGLTVGHYHDWRRAELERDRLRGVWRPIPHYKALQRHYGRWPFVLAAAGIISQRQAQLYSRGAGQRTRPELAAWAVWQAGLEVGPELTQDAYFAWRRRAVCDPRNPRPPKDSVLARMFGSWALVRRALAQARREGSGGEGLLEILVTPAGTKGR